MPLVGLRELAGAVAVRAREGALEVAEELALHELVGDRRAVDDDEVALAAAQLVQRAGEELLAGAGLARDEHRRVRGRHGGEHVEQARDGDVRTDDAVRLAERGEGLAVRRREGLAGQALGDGVQPRARVLDAGHDAHLVEEAERTGRVAEGFAQVVLALANGVDPLVEAREREVAEGALVLLVLVAIELDGLEQQVLGLGVVGAALGEQAEGAEEGADFVDLADALADFETALGRREGFVVALELVQSPGAATQQLADQVVLFGDFVGEFQPRVDGRQGFLPLAARACDSRRGLRG